MPVHKSCANCLSKDCVDKLQLDFDELHVNYTGEHDKRLVDARMLGVHSSTESRKTTDNSNKISTKRYSDNGLKRFMSSFDKMRTFLRRHPRAKTHMEAHAHNKPLQRNNTI